MTRRQRTAINRRNAQRSTGPTSPEGKAASCRNALKHGLRAEVLTLPNEDPAEVAARTEAWIERYQPDDPAACALVEQAALASLRLNRCARFEQATIAKQVREAEAGWDLQRVDELARLRLVLAADPAAALVGLKRFGAGCRWLLQRWERLRDMLGEVGSWNAHDDLDEALRLLGFDPSRVRQGAPGFVVVMHNLVARPDTTDAQIDRLRDPRQRPAAGETEAPDRATSRRELKRLVDAEIDRLVAIAAVWESIETPDRAEARDRALVLNDPATASRLLRCQAAAQSAFHRAYNALTKLDKEEVEEDETAAVEAVAPNEPNAAAGPSPKVEPAKVCDESDVVVSGAETAPARGEAATPPAPALGVAHRWGAVGG